MSRLRTIALVWPAELCLVLSLLLTSVVFTVFPEALEHTPISFETRGIIHHAWHYLILASSASAAAGLMAMGNGGQKHALHWAPRARLMGLIGIMVSLLLNLIAVVSDDLSGGPPAGGLDLALRAAVVVFLGIRVYQIVRPPELQVVVDAE